MYTHTTAEKSRYCRISLRLYRFRIVVVRIISRSCNYTAFFFYHDFFAELAILPPVFSLCICRRTNLPLNKILFILKTRKSWMMSFVSPHNRLSITAKENEKKLKASSEAL